MNNFTLEKMEKQGAPVLVAIPDIDWKKDSYIGFHFDTVKIDVELVEPTQQRHLLKKLNKVTEEACYASHADCLDGDGNKGGRKWRLTIQNPRRESIDAIREFLIEAYGCSGEMRLHRLDVAMDVTLVENTPDRRTEIMRVLAACYVVPERFWTGDNWEEGARVMDYNHGRSSLPLAIALLGDLDRIRDTDTHQTIYFGADLSKKCNAESTGWKLYRKVYNIRDGVEIPVRVPSVRFEVSIGRDELGRFGLNDVNDLQGWKFRQFSAKEGYFKFWYPTAVADRWEHNEAMLKLLIPAFYAARSEYRGLKERNKPGMAHGQLNGIVQDRLKRLAW